ncbi:MAG: DUF58 domain-containing protein [Deltaproteobacteria bacterium]|nr:DUF58 domain-containing protein [Deltaproteobacteria bacterium]
MLAKEILKKIRKIEISTRKDVSSLVGGEYHSVFKGRGMEFDEVKHYYPGDQISAIDWKVTARTGNPFVKRFVEERELTVMLVVDASASHDFGSSEKSKKDLIAEVGALLAFSALRNNDRVGLLTFSEDVDLYLPPRKGRAHGMRVIRELVTMSPPAKGTSITKALEYLAKVEKGRSIVFLISDFIDEGYEKELSIISKKHDLLLLRIKDEMESALPLRGLVELEDAETGERFTADPADRDWQDTFAALGAAGEETWQSMTKKMKLDAIDIDTVHPYIVPLRNFFKRRAKRY